MAYRGRYRLGEHVPLAVVTGDGLTIAADPTAAPVCDLYRDGAKVTSFKMPVADPAQTNGFFAYRLFLGGGHATGRYEAVYRWVYSGSNYSSIDVFEVVAGGHQDGAVLAIYQYQRPHAKFLVHQTDAGKIRRGKNPTF